MALVVTLQTKCEMISFSGSNCKWISDEAMKRVWPRWDNVWFATHGSHWKSRQAGIRFPNSNVVRLKRLGHKSTAVSCVVPKGHLPLYRHTRSIILRNCRSSRSCYGEKVVFSEFLLVLCVTCCARARFKLRQLKTQHPMIFELSLLQHLINHIIPTLSENEPKRTKAPSVMTV